MSAVQLNQSAEGAEGLGIIRSNKVGETETVMLNCQVCTVIIMTKKKQKQINKNSIKKKVTRYPGFEPGTHRSKVYLHNHYTMEDNHITGKNNQYILKL